MAVNEPLSRLNGLLCIMHNENGKPGEMGRQRGSTTHRSLFDCIYVGNSGVILSLGQLLNCNIQVDPVWLVPSHSVYFT